MNARIFRLLETHQRIDRALRDKLKRRRPDPVRAGQLKKLKLRVKDLIFRIHQRAVTA
jgi:uncharacterized protein YdcH (DUF465 family)